MKTILIICFVLIGNHCLPQTRASFKKDFDEIEGIYNKNLTPYFDKLIVAQLEPLPESPTDSVLKQRTRLIEVRVKHCLELAKEFTDNARMVLGNELAMNYSAEDRNRIVLLFENGLKWQFIGLEYEYFKKCREEVTAMKK